MSSPISFDGFLDSAIFKRSSVNLFWGGEEDLIKFTIDAARSRNWYLRNRQYFAYQEWTSKFLGKPLVKNIPITIAPATLPTEGVVPCNLEFENYLGAMTRARTLNDENYQLLLHFSKYFNLYWHESEERILIYPKDEQEISKAKFKFSYSVPNSETNEIIQGSLAEYSTLSDSDKQFQNALLLIKEVMDGYVDLRSHSVAYSENGTLKVTQYKMAEDIVLVLDHRNNRVISINQTPTRFSCRKSSSAWVVVEDSTASEEDYQVFKHFLIRDIVNPDGSVYKEYTLYGAYTHILRKILNFLPQQWQLNFLLGQQKESWLAGCRRMGKTTLAAYAICREILAMPAKEQFRNRPRKALFVAPTKDKYKEVIDYFMEYTSKIRELRNIVYDKKLERIVYEDQALGLSGRKVSTPLSICDFSTSRGFEAGRGKAADWIGIEEAGFVDENVFDNLMPIIEGEGARLFCISTINYEEPAQWFYRELTRAEEKMRNGHKGVLAMRVTIDEIDERVMSFAQKEATKDRALLRGWAYYYAELYATVPSKNSVFDTSGFFLSTSAPRVANQYVLAYDPGKRADYGSITVSAVSEGKLIQIETHRFQGLDYHEQRERFVKIKEKFASGKSISIMDATGVGEAVREIFRGCFEYHVWYSSRKKPAELDSFGSWNVGKRDLVEIAQSLMESKQVAALGDQDILGNEMVNFTEFKTKAGNYTYEAKTGHDDVVNCFLLACFVYGKFMGHFREQVSAFSKKGGVPGYGYKPKIQNSNTTRFAFG